MSIRQRNSASAKAWLAQKEAEGQVRATRRAQERVGAVHLQMQQGVSAFEAAVTAVAAETGRPLDEVRAWLTHQREKFLAAKAKLEQQFTEARS